MSVVGGGKRLVSASLASGSEIPASLACHIQRKLMWGLEQWSPPVVGFSSHASEEAMQTSSSISALSSSSSSSSSPSAISPSSLLPYRSSLQALKTLSKESITLQIVDQLKTKYGGSLEDFRRNGETIANYFYSKTRYGNADEYQFINVFKRNENDDSAWSEEADSFKEGTSLDLNESAEAQVHVPHVPHIFDIDAILTIREESLVQNIIVYENIISHHNNIKSLSWDEAKTQAKSLTAYAAAATVMGDKAWVKNGNDYLRKFAFEYFIEGKASKFDYKLSMSRKRKLKATVGSGTQSHSNSNDSSLSISGGGDSSSSSSSSGIGGNSVSSDHSDRRLKGPGVLNRDERINAAVPSSSSFLSNPGPNPPSTDFKIKLLDVGSCYNPFANLPQFDVTAIDLCPSDSAIDVHQCDFLEVSFKNSASPPELTSKVDESGKTHSAIASLTTQYYNAVVISLVLSYLPDPSQRIKMIRNARLALSKDPYRGLLLIFEKESILQDRGIHKSRFPCFLNHWKHCISNQGFELLHYNKVVHDNRMGHVFAFRLASESNDNSNSNSNSESNSGSNPFSDLLMIKSDNFKDIEQFYNLYSYNS